jgi:competence protein ComGC
MFHKNGIVLSEILLVMVLLGILASIIIPNLSGVGPRSRPSILASDLLMVRSRIECYKLHHNGQLPASKGEDLESFLCKTALQRLPLNPFNDLRTVRVDGAVAGANIGGWRFDTLTGAFQADDSPDHAMF